jgi:site-specific DNA recombinase
MRAVIYARYSSDQQNERSIDDQVRLCRSLAERLGMNILAVYADYAISGSHLLSRPEALRLLEDARLHRFDIVIAESLDRLSRDQEHIASIYKRLLFAGVRMTTVAEGEISELHIGLKGTMAALFLKDLAQKVRRGASGRIAAGKSAGGRAYGYDVVRTIGADGECIRGERRIDEAEANVVRRIFADYVGGKSPRAIAAALNAEGVPAPAGGLWNASTINGHPQRGNGILYNRLYRGELVWNRVSMVKDPDTGRRVSRPNDPKDWIVVEVPEFRIVPEELWQTAQSMKRGSRGLPLNAQHRPRHLFAGLLRCAQCGGAYVAVGRAHVGCSNYSERGTCTNGGSSKRADIERRVLDGLRAKMLHPEALRAAVQAYHEERRRLADERTMQRRDHGKRLANMSAEIERLVDAICAGTATKASNARLVALEAEKEELERTLAALEAADQVVDIHPGAMEAYTRAVDDLAAALAAGGERQAGAAALIRRLVDKIEIRPMGRGRPPEVTLYGRLAELLSSVTTVHRAFATQASLVAGEGLEPPTLGL